jgi:hypothetical protein
VGPLKRPLQQCKGRFFILDNESGNKIIFFMSGHTSETRTYTGTTSGPGGFDGYAGLTLGTSYQGEEQNVLVPSKEEGVDPVPVRRVVIQLASGCTTSVTPEQWQKWFVK